MTDGGLFSDVSAPPGFRLHRLELFNWGTFDSSQGEVYVVRLDGETALLVGKNGSGKSTLVDALLTLLVRPNIRNFNVAAGGKKRERSERTYIMGAYDRNVASTGDGIEIQYLRPKMKQPTVILAAFRNARTGAAFTVAQVLYLTADQRAEKVYCFSEGDRSIPEIVEGVESTEGIVRTLRDRSFSATRVFAEAEGWFQDATQVKTKAMEVFNQTVAVKDIQRLNDFIRQHMLEAKNWSDKVGRLLEHFSELTAAHRNLVRARQHLEFLDPVASVGEDFARRRVELESAEGVRAAVRSFFCQRTLDLFVPESQRLAEVIQSALQTIDSLGSQLEDLDERRRSLQNEIDVAGGERLRLIPALIKEQRAWLASKAQTRERFERALRAAGLDAPVQDRHEFRAVREEIPVRRERVSRTVSETEVARQDRIVERAQTRRRLAASREEAEVLAHRRDNLPPWCVAIRRQLCGELGIPERDVPFVAELVAVRPADRDWEASIEKVLRSYALTLLVPQRYYEAVCRHAENTRLVDERGRGQRLVYDIVGENFHEAAEPSDPDSLVHKLHYKPQHPLVPWVRAEIQRRYDFTCCDDVDAFRRARGRALTRARHVKGGRHARHHDKDDRDRALDPRYFVLGWDNREKRKRLALEIERLETEDVDLTSAIDRLDAELEALRGQLAALQDLRDITTHAAIDTTPHEAEIQSLEKEKKQIEDGSDTIRGLKERLAKVRASHQAVLAQRDDHVGTARQLETRQGECDRLAGNARKTLAAAEADGSLDTHRAYFEALEGQLGNEPLTVESLFETQERFRDDLDTRIDTLRARLGPIQDHLTSAMSQFLRAAPEAASDLDATPEYLHDFLALRQRIIDDDLPRHEKRFKERLHERVIQEIGLFRADLEQERRAIEAKIEVLNESLRKVEYRPGEYLQLQAQTVTDREIVDFRNQLKACLEHSFEDTPEANEAKYQRIHELIGRLQDEDNRRWRDKVIDVRRWLDFAANVIDVDSGQQVSRYDDSTGQSGGEKAKLAFTILVAAIAYQYDLDPEAGAGDRFHFVVVDEMFSKVDDQYAEYALDLFKQFDLQLLIVAPLDAKARVTQPYVGRYIHVNKRDHVSEIFQMTAERFEQQLADTDAAAS